MGADVHFVVSAKDQQCLFSQTMLCKLRACFACVTPITLIMTHATWQDRTHLSYFVERIKKSSL